MIRDHALFLDPPGRAKKFCSIDPVSLGALASAAAPIVGKLFGGGGGGGSAGTALPQNTRQEVVQSNTVNVITTLGGSADLAMPERAVSPYGNMGYVSQYGGFERYVSDYPIATPVGFLAPGPRPVPPAPAPSPAPLPGGSNLTLYLVAGGAVVVGWLIFRK